VLLLHQHFALFYRWKRQWLCFMHIRPRRLPESEKWSKKTKNGHCTSLTKCTQSFLFNLYPVCCSLLLTTQFVLLHICSFLNFEISLAIFRSANVACACELFGALHSDFICYSFANPSVIVARLHNPCSVAVAKCTLC